MERISALMDGELEQREAVGLIPVLKQRDDVREAWATYHLIGEAMRGQTCKDCGVAQAVKSKLVAEPTVLAPRAASGGGLTRRWALPGMAAAAAVATVTWMGFLQPPASTGDIQPISFTEGRPGVMNTVHTFTELVPTTNTSTAAPAIQLTTSEYQPYLMAHQPFSPSMAIQGLAPYMRTVSTGAAER